MGLHLDPRGWEKRTQTVCTSPSGLPLSSPPGAQHHWPIRPSKWRDKQCCRAPLRGTELFSEQFGDAQVSLRVSQPLLSPQLLSDWSKGHSDRFQTNVTTRTKIQTFLKATKKVQIKKKKKAMSTYLRETEQIQQNTNSKIMTKLAPNISHVTNTTGLHALIKRKRLSTQLARQASPGAAQLTACELPCRPRSTPTGNPVQGAHGQSPDPARIISISQFLFWSSVGERAKGRRHRSKDEGQGPGKEQP